MAFLTISKSNSPVWKIVVSGLNETVVPCFGYWKYKKSLCPLLLIYILVLGIPVWYSWVKISPFFLTSTQRSVDNAFTTAAPTP